MITNFKLFENFEEDENGEIRVVAIVDDLNGIIKGHTYVVSEINERGGMSVKDIVNNRVYHGHINWFVSENEYKYGEKMKKYNI